MRAVGVSKISRVKCKYQLGKSAINFFLTPAQIATDEQVEQQKINSNCGYSSRPQTKILIKNGNDKSLIFKNDT